MLVEMIFTGSELLQGRVLNSHAQYLGQWLTEHGFEVGYCVVVGDECDRLEQVLRVALERAELILITGGLGPTTDDLTKEVVAKVLDLPMILDEDSLEHIKGLFRSMNMEMPESNIRQAYIPKGATVLPNKLGSAPGVLLEHRNKTIALLPGPPMELKGMFEEELAPVLLPKRKTLTVIKTRAIKVTGIAESAVQDLLTDLGGQGNPGLSYLASPGQLTVRVTGKAADAPTAEQMVADMVAVVSERLDGFIFGYDGDNIEEVVGRALLAKNMTISTAESCTGGMIGARLVDVPGSSAYVLGGVISYSNEMKISLLGVPPEILEKHGAVSEETAQAMARGVQRLTSSDLGLAVTGVAGPDGGSAEKPVGLVYIALAAKDQVICRRFLFPGNRMSVRTATVFSGLNMVLGLLKD